MSDVTKTWDRGAIVRELIEAWSTGNAEKTARWICDDVEYHMTGSHPFSCRVGGAEALRGLLKQVRQAFADDSLRYHVDRVLVCGTTVVTTFKGSGLLANGNIYKNDYCMICDFKEDKVAQITDFFDSYHVHQVMMLGA